MARNLICVAKGRDGLWEAICLDLDIAVAGPSLEAVQESLNEAIFSYIDDALQEQEPTRSQLLNRSVPFWSRVRWTWPFILAALFGKKKQGVDATVEYPVACPA